jgi:hypothetical protein
MASTVATGQTLRIVTGGGDNTMRYIVIGGVAFGIWFFWEELTEDDGILHGLWKALGLAQDYQNFAWSVGNTILNTGVGAVDAGLTGAGILWKGTMGDKKGIADAELQLLIDAGSGDNAFMSGVFDFLDVFGTNFKSQAETASQWWSKIEEGDPVALWTLYMYKKHGGSIKNAGSFEMFQFAPKSLRDLLWSNIDRDLDWKEKMGDVKYAPILTDTLDGSQKDIYLRHATMILSTAIWGGDLGLEFIEEKGTKSRNNGTYLTPNHLYMKMWGVYKGTPIDLHVTEEVGILGKLHGDVSHGSARHHNRVVSWVPDFNNVDYESAQWQNYRNEVVNYINGANIPFSVGINTEDFISLYQTIWSDPSPLYLKDKGTDRVLRLLVNIGDKPL